MTRTRASLLDITRQKRTEEELKSLATALSCAGEGVVIANLNCEIEYANSAYCQQTGYRLTELVGTCADFLGHISEKDASPPWSELLQGHAWRGSYRAQRKDGTFYDIDATVAPVVDDAGKAKRLVAIKRDVTRERRAELANAELQAKMNVCSRLSSLGFIASSIGHEINTPLAIITGNADLLARGEECGSPMRPKCLKLLDGVTRAAGRIEKIVDELGRFSRQDDGDPFQCESLRNIIANAMTLCQYRFEQSGIALSWDPIPEDVKVLCRPTLLSQVFLNLLGNAHDAVLGLDTRWTRVACHVGEAKVEVSITDSGGGIPQGIREFIFDELYTTKQPGLGTGLGLSISRKIARELGGDIAVEVDCPNTHFVVRLPRWTQL